MLTDLKWKIIDFLQHPVFFYVFGPDLSESVGALLQNDALGVFFGTHPWNLRNPRKWCHEVRFRCLLPRTLAGQDDGRLSKLPQIKHV